jgi:hypothetical protein
VKVIRSSNYDDEGPGGTEHVVRDGLAPEEAERMAATMNADPKSSDRDFFRAVADDYVLYVFEP